MPEYTIHVNVTFRKVQAASEDAACQLATTWVSTCRPEPDAIESYRCVEPACTLRIDSSNS